MDKHQLNALMLTVVDWQDRALKYEQALREIVAYNESIGCSQATEAVIAHAALDKPGTEAMDEVIEYVNCPKCGGRAVSVTHKIAALDKPGTPAENSANEVENQPSSYSMKTGRYTKG